MNTLTKIFMMTIALLVVTTTGCGSGSSDEATLEEHDTTAVAVADVEAGAVDWCAEHAIAESACPFCNPGLIEELGWCAGHEVAEALCWI